MLARCVWQLGLEQCMCNVLCVLSYVLLTYVLHDLLACWLLVFNNIYMVSV